MLRITFLCLLTMGAVLLEPIVGSQIATAAIRPELLLIPWLAAVVLCPGPPAVVWGGAIGLVCDCLTGPCLGPRMAAFAVIAAIGSLATSRPKPITGILFFSFACALAAQTASWAIPAAFEGRPRVGDSDWAQVAGTSLATALLFTSGSLVARRLTRSPARGRFDEGRTVAVGWQQNAD